MKRIFTVFILSILFAGISHNLAAQACSDLFISEYIEGSSNNKAFEIFNPTASPVDLTDYAVYRYNNGSNTASDSLLPQGMLPSMGVFVIGNPSAALGILGESDTLHSMTFYNGDDAIALIKTSTNDTLDIFGVIGQDPGFAWQVGSGFTSNRTLVRKGRTQNGSTDWAFSANTWEVFPSNTFDSLGAHTMIACGRPILYFSQIDYDIIENAGTVSLTVGIQDANSNPTTCEVVISGGTAGVGTDFFFTIPTVVTFPANSSADQTVIVPIVDDMVIEPFETAEFALKSATNNAAIANGEDVASINILDNDLVINTYPIALVHTEDVDGVPDSNGVFCKVGGVVTTIDFDGNSGYSFYIQDNTGGINVFNFSDVSGYQASVGDSIRAIGDIGHFNGLTEIIVDSIILISQNHPMPPMMNVDSLGEFTEGKLIRLNNVTVHDPSQWPGPFQDRNVEVVTAALDTFIVRIDRTTNIDGNVSVPTGVFDVIGAGAQFDGDASAPYDTGYQIFPRWIQDIVVPTLGSPCADLYFSEYIEGSGNNKGLEVYNPTNLTVDLSNYEIYESGNGGSFSNTFSPLGMLAPGDVFIVTTNQADSAGMQSKADTVLSFPSVVHFNGDDAIVLINHLNGDTIDIIGRIGEDPGSSWPVPGGSTQNHTLVRNNNVYNGDTSWATAALGWTAFPQNEFDSLGAHTQLPCGTVIPPQVFFALASQDVDESVGTVNVEVGIINENSDTTRVDVYVKGGTAMNGVDYNFTSPTTVTFLPNSNTAQSVTVTIVDDAVIEPGETIILGLQNATNNANIGQDTTVITIDDNDTPIPVYPIATVTSNDVDGIVDSLNVECEIRGIVFGINYRPGGLQFHIHDGTGGINVFSFSDTFGYHVTESDSIHIQGTIAQFRGLTEIFPDSIRMVSTGHDLPVIHVVDGLSEDTESELVKLVGWSIVDTNEWGGAFSFNLRIFKGTDTTVVRIDSDTDIFGDPAPTDSLLNFTGVGSQFSSSTSAPFLDGYQMLPRYRPDIEATQVPGAAFSDVHDNLTVVFTDLSTNCPDQWAWDFGDGNSSTDQHPVHTYAANGIYTVCLIASNPAGSDTICDTIMVGDIGIIDLGDGLNVNIYPNPSDRILYVEGDIIIEQLELFNLEGRLLIAKQVNDLKFEMDISYIPNGIYIMKVKTEKGTLIREIVKQ